MSHADLSTHYGQIVVYFTTSYEPDLVYFTMARCSMSQMWSTSHIHNVLVY